MEIKLTIKKRFFTPKKAKNFTPKNGIQEKNMRNRHIMTMQIFQIGIFAIYPARHCFCFDLGSSAGQIFPKSVLFAEVR